MLRHKGVSTCSATKVTNHHRLYIEQFWERDISDIDCSICRDWYHLAECGKCGYELPDGAKYCSQCGQSTYRVTVEKFEVASDDLVKKIKEILHEANVTKIIVENEQGKTLLEIPVTVGVVGALFAPWLAALGAIGAIATKCTVKVERRE